MLFSVSRLLVVPLLAIVCSAQVAPTKAERLEHLIDMLDSEFLQELAIAKLVAIGKPAIPSLQKALDHENALVSEGAVLAFTLMKPVEEKVLELLGEVMADKTKSDDARITSLQFLARTIDTNPAMFTAVCDLTDASEPAEVRMAAMRELAKTEKHRHDVVNLLETILRSKQLDVVECATTSLGVIAKKEDQRIVMLLVRQLKSPHTRIQRAAIYALAGKGARVHLERLRKKADLAPSVMRALAEVLKELAGFVIADYSDDHIVQIDLQGNVVARIEKIAGTELSGAWDAELLDNGNYLITEKTGNRVTEVTPDNRRVWTFGDLKEPHDADRLRNGNTLIADAFGRRVIEVDKKGKIVWKFDENICPYDVDRLPNGNTLIADTHGDRVIEVNPAGRIVWKAKNVPNLHDADRLPNGNTLLTIRMLNEVREVDPAGRTVFRLKKLDSPSDADRLPDGRTVVAENGQLRIFDAAGKEVWRKAVTWAVEVNPVWKYQRQAQKRATRK